MNELTTIAKRIHNLPNRPPFMLARDISDVYGTTVEQVSQAVRRHPARFPEDFTFLLTEPEIRSLQIEGVKSLRPRDRRMRAFTHNGANALAGVLKTAVADERSVLIARAFTALEQHHRPLGGPAPLRLLPCRGVLLPVITHPNAGDGVLVVPLQRALGKRREYLRKVVEREPALQAHYILLAGEELFPAKGFGRLKSTVNVTAMLTLEGLKLFAMLGYAGGDGQDLVLAVHRLQTGQLALA